jgi:hypothetical protein
MGADKNSSRRRWRLQQDEHGFQHTSPTTTQVGQAHVATGVPLDLGTNKQPSEPKHTNTHSGNLHGLLPVLHRTDRWPAPVRLVTPVRRWTETVRPVAAATAQQVFQKASVTSLGHGTKTPPKHNLQGRKTLHKT